MRMAAPIAATTMAAGPWSWGSFMGLRVPESKLTGADYHFDLARHPPVFSAELSVDPMHGRKEALRVSTANSVVRRADPKKVSCEHMFAAFIRCPDERQIRSRVKER